MHFCQDEMTAIMMGIPFLGWFCVKCRQICLKCAEVLRLRASKPKTGECTHHNHKDK